jgi:DNA-binding NtrC family response regulator
MIDDEADVLNVSKIWMQKLGSFTVETVQSGEEALNLLHSSKFDAVISDYQMTQMDGIELLKAVKSETPDMPFILFTGRGREEVVIEALNNGADFYLQKGIGAKSLFTELVHKTQQAVQKRRVEDSLKQSQGDVRALLDAKGGVAYALARRRAVRNISGPHLLGDEDYAWRIVLAATGASIGFLLGVILMGVFWI